ncbi:alpha/beta hydrolase [Metabacillus sp. HB246100]|uniref:alpha/beta hydrolase n=1 Tax=Bacillus weihaiensis TaxID=1547283 RepID=UPI002355ABF8|nr:alpha/beta fold hydrolase [Bacillus weihaiensis]
MKREESSILEGAESRFYQGNQIGILLCHGFNGTPQSMQFIGERLSQLGYTVSIPRLSGHGTHYRDMEKVHYENWKQDLQEEYDRLKESCLEVYVVGQSMGGALTLQLAASNSSISGIALINAAVTDVAYQTLRTEKGPMLIEEGEPDIHKPGVYEITYSKVPLHAVHELLDLMDETKEKVAKVESPVLLITSAVDHVVPPSNSDFIYENLRSKEVKRVTLPHSYHVASMDYDATMIVDNLHQYIENLSQEPSLS